MILKTHPPKFTIKLQFCTQTQQLYIVETVNQKLTLDLEKCTG